MSKFWAQGAPWGQNSAAPPDQNPGSKYISEFPHLHNTGNSDETNIVLMRLTQVAQWMNATNVGHSATWTIPLNCVRFPNTVRSRFGGKFLKLPPIVWGLEAQNRRECDWARIHNALNASKVLFFFSLTCHGGFFLQEAEQIMTTQTEGTVCYEKAISDLETRVVRLAGWHDDLVRVEMIRMIQDLSEETLPGIQSASNNEKTNQSVHDDEVSNQSVYSNGVSNQSVHDNGVSNPSVHSNGVSNQAGDQSVPNTEVSNQFMPDDKVGNNPSNLSVLNNETGNLSVPTNEVSNHAGHGNEAFPGNSAFSCETEDTALVSFTKEQWGDKKTPRSQFAFLALISALFLDIKFDSAQAVKTWKEMFLFSWTFVQRN